MAAASALNVTESLIQRLQHRSSNDSNSLPRIDRRAQVDRRAQGDNDAKRTVELRTVKLSAAKSSQRLADALGLQRKT
jgi:hypothetical protein